MDLKLFIKMIWLFKIIVMFQLFIESSTRSPGSSLEMLKMICCLEDKIHKIKGLSPKCTSVARYSTGSLVNNEDIQSIRGSLKYIFIINEFSFDDIQAKMKKNKVTEFVNFLSEQIIRDKIDGMVFDNIDLTRGRIENLNSILGDVNISDLQSDIQRFVLALHIKHPDLLIGLAIDKFKEVGKDVAFPNITELEKNLDFYLIKTYDYDECKLQTKQEHMAVLSPVQDMYHTLDQLKKLKYDLSMAVIIIRIIVKYEVEKSFARNDKFEESYSCLCGEKHDDAQTYCKDTLTDFYNKGKLIEEFNTTGAFVQSMDRDDHDNVCNCGKFPIIDVIYAGSNNRSEPIDKLNCQTFGL